MPKVSLYRNRVPLKLGHKHSQGRYSRLELDEGKLSRPVLRRGDGSNPGSLAGMVASTCEETGRLAQAMTPKDITVTQEETCTGGLCLVAIEPVSNDIVLEQPAEARDQEMWNELMA